ncbi:MAG: hypothetical protein Q9178_007324 [Gyalolechia marmorata]
MEPVSLAASIVQLVNVTAKTIKYLNSVKHASEERTGLLREASSLLPVLLSLQTQVDLAKGPEPWFQNLRALNVDNGPLDQLQNALEHLAKKLKPKKGIKDVTRAFVWTLEKDFSLEVFQTIERVKSSISLALEGDTFKLAQAIKADTATIGILNEHVSDLSLNVDGLSLKQDLQERRQVLAWLSPLNFFKTQQDIFARRVTGTGQWLIVSPGFQDWMSGSTQTLCCPGIPGAGKSVLASIVVDFLRNGQPKQPPVGVAAVYCNFKEHEMQSLENLLAGLCMQLIQATLPLPETLTKAYCTHREKGTRPSIEDILQTFEEVLKPFGTVYLVIDALDECLEQVRSRLILHLKAFSPRIRLLVTTRFIDGILSEFRNDTRLEIRANQDDLRRYISSSTEGNSRLARQLQGKTALAHEICESIIATADGMFLAAKLHVDSLASKTSVKALKKAMENLPATLNDLYDDAMRRIDSQSQDDRELAEKAIRWVAYTYRPLRLEVLLEALAIEPGEKDLDLEAIPPMSLILDVCAGLLILDEQSEAVRLVHYTAQDYFNALAESAIQEAHASIARDCLTYLSYDCIQEELPGPRSDRSAASSITEKANIGGRSSVDGECIVEECLSEKSSNQAIVGKRFSHKRSYHILTYASTFWGLHVVAGPEKSLIIEIEKFLVCNPRVTFFTPWDYYIFHGERPPHYFESYPGCLIAAYFGLIGTLKRLLRDPDHILKQSCDGWDHPGWYALHFAAFNDQTTAVELLLDVGADIETRTSLGMTPLHVAILHGSIAVARALVDRGADVMALTKEGETPASLVRSDLPDPFLHLLLNAGAHISAQEVFDCTPLMRKVIDNRDSTMAEWLFNRAIFHGMDRRPYQSSALAYASATGTKAMVGILLKYGADPNSRSNIGKPALHCAIDMDKPSVVRLLLNSGSDVDAQSLGRTALISAAYRGCCTECVDLLLACHPDVDKHGEYGRTALMVAELSGYPSIVLRILQHVGNIDVQGKYGETALHRACAESDREMVKNLVQAGATVDIRSMCTVSIEYTPNDPGEFITRYDSDDNYILAVLHNPPPARHVLIAPLAGEVPTVLMDMVYIRESVKECTVWQKGMTAFDIAALGNHEENMLLLRPLTTSTTEFTKLPFDQWLCEEYRLSSIDEVVAELQRRWDTEYRTYHGGPFDSLKIEGPMKCSLWE